MAKNVYQVLTIIFGIISIIGLIRFVGGITAANAGIFIFPLILAIFTFVKSKKTVRNNDKKKGGHV